jgi:two-component system alkaline phosphatase synthesis response regulator PhoP
MKQILVVEDEKNIAELITYNLERDGHRVKVATDGKKALEVIEREMPDLVILDLMLPKIDGLEVLRQIRSNPKAVLLPVIVLTAKTQEADRVVGLELGADDYVTKPFSMRELLARVKAVLRRSEQKSPQPVWRCGQLYVDWERRVVKVGAKAVEVTPKEFELLRCLVQADGRVCSREALLNKIWGYDRAEEIQTRTVDIHISQLRHKLKSEGQRILTVTGVGYRFDMP